ncbi:MAG: TIGR02466 family protein [Sphingomicrobium sp.]
MTFTKLEIRTLFPVPLLTTRLDGHESLNARLLKEIARRRRGEPGIDRSNRYGWHSEPDLFERTEPAHVELVTTLNAVIEASTDELMPEYRDQLVARHEGWVNVSPNHAMNAPHDHPGAFWSGVYYVHVPPPPDADDTFSGAIEFIDPRGSIGSNARIETRFTRGKFTIRPANGTCLLWPSFLRHWVHPNRSVEDRVTVAFNSWYAQVSD